MPLAGSWLRERHTHFAIRIVNATTGELLRELTLDPTRDYQPRTTQK